MRRASPIFTNTVSWYEVDILNHMNALQKVGTQDESQENNISLLLFLFLFSAFLVFVLTKRFKDKENLFSCTVP